MKISLRKADISQYPQFAGLAERLHREIYLSDARKVAPEKWKTVFRHPIRKVQ